ncbi:hypothetical protein [Oceanibaculum sp.]|uniref:hypothetical protein n=1 Tax=Oceanibaculum sp. TaxID=1903597 RepID=UPI002585EE7B|nr:hypothetical protein [Oceanibaculum sp.]MCH2394634.1 hypothetical protein [Oceanibaculum sp.]
MARIVYLDQNAWIELAKGSWEKERYPKEYEALAKVVDLVRSGSIVVPLTFANIYETLKTNVPGRRVNLALVQSLISGGWVFRGRRRVFTETLAAYLATKSEILRPDLPQSWFLSDVWLEAVADYTPEIYGLEVPARVINSIQRDPGRALFDCLAFSDDDFRRGVIQRYSAASADLIARIEYRRARVASEPISVRKRAYGAGLIIDEFDFILSIAQDLGLGWSTVSDIGSSLIRSIAVDVPVLNIERELAVRLEDQGRAISENDLRDMMSFITVLPFADIVVAEKQFVNLSRQARLDERYDTRMLTSIFAFLEDEG